MNGRDLLGFVLLGLGVACSVGGIGAGLRDIPLGWAALLVGALLLFVSFRMTRAPIGTESEGE